MVSGAHFGAQRSDGGLVTPDHESLTFSTARAELEAAGIHDAFHNLLLSAGLDLETLQVECIISPNTGTVPVC